MLLVALYSSAAKNYSLIILQTLLPFLLVFIYSVYDSVGSNYNWDSVSWQYMINVSINSDSLLNFL